MAATAAHLDCSVLLVDKNNFHHKRFAVDMLLDIVGVEAKTFTRPAPCLTELINACLHVPKS